MPSTIPALSSPDWFLERFHVETSTFTLIPTTRARLQETAFHDGRSDLKVRPDIIHAKIEDALAWLRKQNSPSNYKIVAHTSFCGSTLLARALDVTQHVVAFREPQVLIDLANLKAANHNLFVQTHLWSNVVDFTFRQLQKTWLPSQVPILKPANWANTLLSELSKLNIHVTYALLTMDLRAYLIANLRGGKPRLKFSLDLLNHLLVTKPEHTQEAVKIQTLEYTPLQQTLCMLALCHAIQVEALIDLQAKNNYIWLTKSDLTNNPTKAVNDVVEHFSLSVPPAELKANISINLQYYSKVDGSEFFNRDTERNMNAKLLHAYANDLDIATEWFETTFPDILAHTKSMTRLSGSA